MLLGWSRRLATVVRPRRIERQGAVCGISRLFSSGNGFNEDYRGPERIPSLFKKLQKQYNVNKESIFGIGMVF